MFVMKEIDYQTGSGCKCNAARFVILVLHRVGHR